MGDSANLPLELRIQQVGPWSMNACVLVCPLTRKSLLVDPGDEPAVLSDMLKETRPQAILVTHGHPDHIGALDVMRGQLKVPVMGHRGDGGGSFEADRWIGPGDRITIGQACLKAHFTPGHTADHLCYAIAGDHRILVGDAIFEGGPGKTWSAADFQTSLKTLRDVILRWPDTTVCYPGHGSRFRLGAIRSAVERFLAKDHGQFFGDAEWGM